MFPHVSAPSRTAAPHQRSVHDDAREPGGQRGIAAEAVDGSEVRPVVGADPHEVNVLPQRLGDLARSVDLLSVGIHQHLQHHRRRGRWDPQKRKAILFRQRPIADQRDPCGLAGRDSARDQQVPWSTRLCLSHQQQSQSVHRAPHRARHRVL